MRSRSQRFFTVATTALVAFGLCALGTGQAQAANCGITTYTKAKGAQTLYASAANAVTGTSVNKLRSTSLIPLASVTKIPTAVAATHALGSDFRFTTKVYATSKLASSITVVGGGDPTLSSTGRTVYTGAPTVSSLAAKIRTWAKGKSARIKTVVINTQRFRTAYSPDYTASDRRYGYVSRVAAFQVDGDRKYPSSQGSTRLSSSVSHATTTLKNALARAFKVKASKIKVKYSTAKLKKTQHKIVSVSSQPLPILLKQMLRPSDNTLANALAFQVAVKTGSARTFAGIQTAYRKVFTLVGVPLAKGMVFRDGSGLSEKDRLQPAFVTRVLRKVVLKPAQYKIVRSGLPVAGVTGTLVSRFTTKYSKVARTHVQAKTGYITSTTSLAGITTAKNHTTVVFTSAVRKSKHSWSTRAAALDNLAAAYYRCGAKK